MKNKYECPLLNREISDDHCFEICAAVEGMIKMSYVPEVKLTREEAEKICFKCKNYKE